MITKLHVYYNPEKWIEGFRWDLLMVLSEACMEENPQFYETFEGDENYMTVASDTLDFPDVWLG